MVSVKRTHSSNPAIKNQDIVRRFSWEIASINVHLQELRSFWAKALGISAPQWMILMALADLDQGEGVPVKVVSKMLHVDPSFVTTQSKMLEKKGFMRRKTSEEDARIVHADRQDLQADRQSGLAAGSAERVHLRGIRRPRTRCLHRQTRRAEKSAREGLPEGRHRLLSSAKPASRLFNRCGSRYQAAQPIAQ